MSNFTKKVTASVFVVLASTSMAQAEVVSWDKMISRVVSNGVTEAISTINRETEKSILAAVDKFKSSTKHNNVTIKDLNVSKKSQDKNSAAE